mmetsp:Transcript_55514/g.129192  ORF Transcript_55514/g.129192 Transcript_55514/m.129192 type:complete len:258 (+) Transcript_55514:91-864(+)|eukprot:CAMPEP_0171075426 /NCGR_PEP_ID=MMETSP0766_2-20121228/12769_1 /TAXON_ID=439317 /ORGANISM="Gambierdiscus australes, Strain CAWD 149" /LENGTH=257 /DNA_ID=CAMNT_0011532293 /DNA_START=85 /DNA_END=858 /DNA_ORIENTATION=+
MTLWALMRAAAGAVTWGLAAQADCAQEACLHLEEEKAVDLRLNIASTAAHEDEVSFLLQLALEVDPQASILSVPLKQGAAAAPLTGPALASLEVNGTVALQAGFEDSDGVAALQTAEQGRGKRTFSPSAFSHEARIERWRDGLPPWHPFKPPHRVVALKKQTHVGPTVVHRQSAAKKVPPEYWDAWLTSSCVRIFGLSKLWWAIICDMLAFLLVLLCIPLLLTCSRRRPAGAPMFDCNCCQNDDEASLKLALSGFEM